MRALLHGAVRNCTKAHEWSPGYGSGGTALDNVPVVSLFGTACQVEQQRFIGLVLQEVRRGWNEARDVVSHRDSDRIG